MHLLHAAPVVRVQWQASSRQQRLTWNVRRRQLWRPVAGLSRLPDWHQHRHLLPVRSVHPALPKAAMSSCTASACSIILQVYHLLHHLQAAWQLSAHGCSNVARGSS